MAQQAAVRGDQFFRNTLFGSQADEHIHQRVLQLADAGDRLLITARGVASRRRQLQPIERALTGQRLPQILRIQSIGSRDVMPAAQERQQRIMS